MTVTPHIVEDILKVYTKNLVSGRSKAGKDAPRRPPQDVVTISEDGRRRMIERLKSEAIEYLKSKG